MRLRYLHLLNLIFLFPFGFLLAQSDATIKGRILDQVTEEGIEYANVAIHSAQDSSILTGVITDEQGYFEIKEVKTKEAYVTAQFLGYQTYTSENFKPEGTINLGEIRLGINSMALDEIEVTGKEMFSLFQLDKQTFKADQFQNAQGGTATDVLRNLPAVSVNALGEISVRGSSGFIIMINGKIIQTDPSTLLNQIPANAIEDIEIITAPSAKYDPDGKAGIIHIKTRQGALDGFFLLANARVGLPSIEPYNNAETAQRYGADLTVNYKKGKWDVSLGMDYNRNDISGRREGYVNTYINNVLTEFPSDGERSFDQENYSGRASVLYTPKANQTIGASFYAGKRTKYRTADILYDYQQRRSIGEESFLGTETYYDLFQQNGVPFQGGTLIDSLRYFNENLRVRRGDFLIGALDYSIQFADQSTLKLSGLYEHTILGGPTDNINLRWPNIQDTLQLQFNDNDNPLDGYRFQADYAKKLGNINWESGYLFRYLRHPGDFIYLERNFQTNEWEVNPEFTNGIELKRQIHSVYSQISGGFGKWQYTVGLRLEYFDRQVTTNTPDTTYLLDQFNPFPSVNLQYDLGNQLFVKASYSRRIDRTTTFKMTPFPEREHSETLEQGDAELLPEFTDLVELGMIKSWKDNSVFATVYYQNVKDVINRVNTVYVNGDSILNRIYTNAGTARAYGLEVGSILYPTKWWRLFIGGNVYNYRIKGNLFEDDINTANTIYSINANADFSVLPTLNVQAAFNYLSERITAQGRDSRFYNPSLTVRKTFWDKKLALTLQWLNVDMGLWNANEQRITTVRDNFFTTTNYVYEVDILMLGVTYQLNQPSKQMKLLKSEFGDKEF